MCYDYHACDALIHHLNKCEIFEHLIVVWKNKNRIFYNYVVFICWRESGECGFLLLQYLFAYLRRGVGISLRKSYSFLECGVRFPLPIGGGESENPLSLFLFQPFFIKYSIIIFIKIK